MLDKIAVSHVINNYHPNIKVFGNNPANRLAYLILAVLGNQKGNRASFYSINRAEYKEPCLFITSSGESF